MIAGALGRRNRYKRRKSEAPPFWSRLRAAVDWGALARRGAVLALLVASLSALTWALNRPVRAVSIEGSFQRVSPVEIERVVAPYLSGGLMSANLDAIQRAVEAIPWVDQVRVQRRWPTDLRLTVIEQTAAARWNGSGLLNKRGELFIRDAAHVPPELPALSGPPGTEQQVATLYLTNEPKMVEAGMRIAAVRLDERGAWEVDLSNGLTVRLGRNHVQDRLVRFLDTASPVVAQRINEIAYVDMRYSNGFAVGWRTAGTPAAGAAPAAPPPAQARTQTHTHTAAPAPAKTHVDHEA